MTDQQPRSPEAVLERIYREGKVPTDDGSPPHEPYPIGLTEEPGRALAELVRREGVGRSLETGFAYGLSTLWIMQGSSGRHTAVDPDQTKGWKGAGTRSVRDAGLAGRFELVEQDSRLALPAMVERGETVDLVFIDGAHRFEYVFLDVCYGLRLVKPGGLLVLDDRWMDAVRAAADYAVKNLGARLEVFEEHAAERRFIQLRAPDPDPKPAWDAFEAFGAAGLASPAEIDAARS